MHRFYASRLDDGVFTLTPEDARHADTVLRLKPGSLIEIFHAGQRFRAELLHLNPETGQARCLDALPSCEPALQVTLFQGIPKGEKMEWIVQKAVELGVNQIVPVEMHRCVVRLNREQAEKKQARWQKIAREAGKQSGRAIEPRISLPLTLTELCTCLEAYDAVLIPWEEAEARSLRSFAAEHPDVSKLGIVIGPEGGMEKDEIDRMKQAGGCPVTLGPRILRTETAGLCALSALMCLYGELEQAPGGEVEA